VSREGSVIVRPISTVFTVLALLLFVSTRAEAQTATVPGSTSVDATIYSISIEWSLAGDTNHNASAAVRYKVRGATAWSSAMALVRVHSSAANTLAGSLLFLAPGTTYDVELSLTDPDGGAERRVVGATTRALPSLPGGRTFHVVPGSGPGDGSSANPFRGIAAAQAMAMPGDTFLLHGGSYGGRIGLSTAGTAAAYVAWKAYGDGEVRFDGVNVSASHVWLEGITIRNQAYALVAHANPDAVVVRRCRFFNNHISIDMQEGGRNWYIADNTIVGDTPYLTESLDGEGIDLRMTGGHTVAHNSISSVADGISYPGANVDLFGNDIFDTSDDGIEADYGGANVRIWGNRIHNAVHNGISFQPQSGAPWYFVRNQIIGNVEAAFKFRTTDRFVLLHNTIVNWGNAWPGDALMCCNEDHLLRAISRNNLWVSLLGGQIWGLDAGVVDWRSDLDYDGFDWGTAANPFAYGGMTYADLPSFSAASGLERHGVRVAKDTCFEALTVPNPPPAPVPPQAVTLRAGCPAVDAGAVLPNINDADTAGAAPDLGAHERGRDLWPYGPRTSPTARLTPMPASIPEGDSAVLTWSTTDADVIVIDGVGQVAPSGSVTVTPSATQTYTLTATGPQGVATATATIVVTSTDPTNPTSPYGGTPVAIPGLIEAERFDEGAAGAAYQDTTGGNSGGAFRNTDVDLEATGDAGGGYNVGWITAGEWLAYTVNVATSGTYTVEARVASPAAGGTFHLEAAGANATGPIAIPNTGGWQAWRTVTVNGVRLQAGVQRLRLVMDTAATGGDAVGNINWIRVSAAPTGGSTPYGGTPAAVPGLIEAERFDEGGAAVAYHDSTTGNSGGTFRATDVDVEPTSDGGGGYNVGWISAGEWLMYTVSVGTTGTYTLQARVASLAAGGTFHVEANGINVTGAMTIPATAGWQAWTTITAPGISLQSGTQRLRLVMDTAGNGGGAVGNINWLRLAAAPVNGSTPFGGAAATLPGLVEAERFDEGGAEVAYRDTTAGNSGGAFRATDVDLEATADGGGGYNVGWLTAGEWLNYTVNVATAGTHALEIRVASPGTGGSFHVEANDRNVTGPVGIPNTEGWQTWTTVTVPAVALQAGPQVLRLVMDAVASSGAVGNINWFRVTAAGGSTPYAGAPRPVPGVVEAEHFDEGGAAVAYHDTTAGNSGGAFRSTDVDIEATSDTGGGYNVGWIGAGEWLHYTVSVATTGLYTAQVRVASPGGGGTFHIEANGVAVTESMAIPATGGWQAWTTIAATGVSLQAGTQRLRVVMDTPGSGGGAVGNINWLRLSAE
jgi:hypothetical protein